MTTDFEDMIVLQKKKKKNHYVTDNKLAQTSLWASLHHDQFSKYYCPSSSQMGKKKKIVPTLLYHTGDTEFVDIHICITIHVFTYLFMYMYIYLYV